MNSWHQHLYLRLKRNVLRSLLPTKVEVAITPQMEGIGNSIAPRIVVICFMAIALAMYMRLYFGVDVSDEGFYMSMSYLFARGGQPFVHEWVAQQGAAIIFAPFVKIYLSLVGSADGLVLFGRHMYFLVSLLASWSIWRLCRTYVTSVAALFPALLPIVFHPGGCPNLSYNSLGALGWLLGLGFLYSCYLPIARGRIAAFAGAACLVVASFAYPSLLLISAIVLCVSFLFPPNQNQGQMQVASVRKNHQTGLLLGVSFIAIPLLYVVFQNGLYPLTTTYKFASAAPHQGGGWWKIEYIFNQIIQKWEHGVLVLSLLGTIAVTKLPKRWRWLGIMSGIIFLVPCATIIGKIWRGGGIGDPSILVLWLGLISPLLFLFRPDRAGLRLLLVIWLPSMIAGLATAWTSSQWVNGALGLMPAAALSLFFVVRTWNLPVQAIRTVPIFFLLIFIAAIQFLHIYTESPLIDLRTRMLSGPYLGLHTGRKSAAIYEITVDLASVRAGRTTFFLVNGDSPGFYLMTDLIPSGPTTWANNSPVPIPLHTAMFKEYFSVPGHLPDVIMGVGAQWEESDLSEWILKKGYVKKIDKPSYRIYVRA